MPHQNCGIYIDVAPLVGAWIETSYIEDDKLDLDVAPLVGAWIETENRK